ncbi:flagellar hook-length control protein FliK [Christensenella intestinihominis]|uniref:flagellar hook-length control protein FliK n=1 Tax=Christensenella intestinihominis TaxID=1851429 RepID=UPI0008309A55|nr:flagellar hook-length control protein FliK [Christensenella intestinihominis]
MMKVNSVAEMLQISVPKTDGAEFAGEFAGEMDKATGAGQVEHPAKKDAAQEPENKAGEQEVSLPNDEKKPGLPEDEKREDVSGFAETIPFIPLNTAMLPNQESQADREPQAQAGTGPAPPFPETGQQARTAGINSAAPVPESPAEEPVIKTGSTPEAVSFVQQVLKEADTMLEKSGRQEDIGAQQLKESLPPGIHDGSAGDVPKAETRIPEETADGKKQSRDHGETEAGKPVAGKQSPVTAPVRSDGKVEFQILGVQPEQMEPLQQKDSIFTRVIEQVKSTVTKEKTEFFLQLKPEHLGGLSIMLSAEEKGIAAKLMTSNHDVQQILQSDMNQLQATLREKGINVVHMEVIYDQTASSTTRDNRDGNRQQENTFGRVQGRTTDGVEDAAAFYDSLSYYDVLAEQGGSVEFSA